ncbi:MAG: Tannase and feruloyl esterase [Gammaproteobacteria bacterium]|nr:Tannase and feruloyl esterase [Gammaproteobacteria bacterium]
MIHKKKGAVRLVAGLLALAAAGASVAAPMECAQLKDLKLPNTRITIAESVAPNPVWIYPPSLFTAMAEKLANGPTGVQKPFCRVVGVIEKEINFEVWLPRQWNGKFQGVGNGGLTGAINYPSMGPALEQGYASASTDTGHRTEQGFFEDEWLEGHPERLVNFAYRAHHLMAQTGKQIVAAYYGKPAGRAYYSGCSSGGWEGLSEAERYPDDYDGIVAGAPAINLVQVQSRGILVAQLSLKNPAGNLTRELASRLAAAAVAKCDAKDGLKDGVIDDPRHCDFDPAELQCKSADSKDCLTAPQVQMARALYGPLKSSGGMKLYPGAALGASPLAELPPSSKPEPVGHAAITLMLPQKPAWTVTTFSPDRDIPVLEKQLGATLDAANPDLHRFQAHGGKLIMYHGWADPLLSPYNTLEYYGNVVQTMGGQQPTDGFVRLFMVPGMEHCRGGSGPNTFDAVASLDDWVEHGVPPERIIATHKGAQGKQADRSRPLCRYPQVARYKGSGSIDEAASFNCQTL